MERRNELRVRVKFFARYREVAGKTMIELEIAEGTTLAELKQIIEHRFPPLKVFSHNLLLAVNGEYAPPHLTLREGEEIAFLPPLSGG